MPSIINLLSEIYKFVARILANCNSYSKVVYHSLEICTSSSCFPFKLAFKCFLAKWNFIYDRWVTFVCLSTQIARARMQHHKISFDKMAIICILVSWYLGNLLYIIWGKYACFLSCYVDILKILVTMLKSSKHHFLSKVQ